MNISEKTTREQLAAIVIKKLKDHNLSAVLVGGSVVSIYTENEYESYDLDFISPNDHRQITTAMKELGFNVKGKNFDHPQCSFTVEFPLGPLGIGDMVPIKPEGKIIIEGVSIPIFSPTQCVMDRLAWFYFNHDRQGLDQAVMLCKHQKVNLEKVTQWSRNEDQSEKLSIFLNHLEKL